MQTRRSLQTTALVLLVVIRSGLNGGRVYKREGWGGIERRNLQGVEVKTQRESKKERERE